MNSESEKTRERERERGERERERERGERERERDCDPLAPMALSPVESMHGGKKAELHITPNRFPLMKERQRGKERRRVPSLVS